MKITRLIVQNYRNIKNVDIRLHRINVLIGENNSGKSNLLKAAALPFWPDEAEHGGKSLNWTDINNEAKQHYYTYILRNTEKIRNGEVSETEFAAALPRVSVEAILQPEETEFYFVKDLAFGAGNSGELVYGIRYEFFPENINDVMSYIKEVLTEEDIHRDNIEALKMNLLPIDFYSHSIHVPGKGSSVSYDTLKNFRYAPLAVRREEFLHTGVKAGAESTAGMLDMNLDTASKITLEKDYQRFLDTLKNLNVRENTIDLAAGAEREGEREIFSKISILPGMPAMNTLLNNAVLGYAGDFLSSQGAGYRNLISLLVQFQAIGQKKPQPVFTFALLEEPETRLSPASKELLADFINSYMERMNTIQLCYSTHSDTFINKADFRHIIVMKDGAACTLDVDE